MIDPVTALGGSSILGAIIGVVSNLILQGGKNKVELERIRFDREQNMQDYQVKLAGKHPPFYSVIMLLAATYCICTGICFIAGDIPVASQGFRGEPTTTSIALGLYKRVSPDKTVYVLTFAGLGTYFMSPIAFILTSVLTGIVPKRGI